MPGRYFGLAAVSLIFGLGFAAPQVRAQDEGVALTDDLSRGELFAQRIAPTGSRYIGETFAFPDDAAFETPGKPRNDSVFGVDISHHNESRCKCKIDWSGMREQKVAFVYLKATQGGKYFDPTFARNWEAVGKLPADQSIYRGAYHFLSSDVDVADQIKNFLRVVPVHAKSDMAPTLDLEWDMRKGPDGKMYDSWSKVKPAEIKARALAWLKAVHSSTGKAPMVYTNRSWWAEMIGEDAVDDFAGYPIWIADYSKSRRATEKPAVMKGQAWALWQFSETGKLRFNGKAQQVDVNIYKGAAGKLKETLGVQ